VGYLIIKINYWVMEEFYMKAINKSELDEFLKIEGEVKGVVFQTDSKYVLQKEGEEGLKKLEKRIAELGYPIDYRKKGEALDLNPIGLRVISLLVIKDTFNWPDSEIRNMGYAAPGFSFVVKLFAHFFISLKKSASEYPSYWTMHYTIGNLEVIDLDENSKEITIHLNDFKIHPIMCLYLEGYFERIYEFAVGKGKGNCTETKCMFKGNPHHEYVFKMKRQ
jgi:hypothetical protein